MLQPPPLQAGPQGCKPRWEEEHWVPSCTPGHHPPPPMMAWPVVPTFTLHW